MKDINIIFIMVFHYLKYVVRIVRVLMKGQSETYEIMQLAHRLEKGLVHQSPKPMWGWEKAERLCLLLTKNKESISYETGLAVINKYLEAKMLVADECKLAIGLKSKYNLGLTDTDGGAIYLPKPIISDVDIATFEKIVSSRHSVRNFDNKHLDIARINKAIKLALNCPSACNRQPFKVYVLSDDLRKSIGVVDESSASLYVTGIIDAFCVTEMLDWIVSPSIFVGYLTLSLHLYGIGSCIYRKDLVCDTEYNRKVKKVCDIPDTEQIILELRIGDYPSVINAAVSNRFSISQITKYL